MSSPFCRCSTLRNAVYPQTRHGTPWLERVKGTRLEGRKGGKEGGRKGGEEVGRLGGRKGGWEEEREKMRVGGGRVTKGVKGNWSVG